jgi:hypothetical protein
MKSKKADTSVHPDDKDTPQVSAQLHKRPMKKNKKKPRIMFTFSPFARCTVLSLPKFSISSPSPSCESSGDDDSQDDEEEQQEVPFKIFNNWHQISSATIMV